MSFEQFLNRFRGARDNGRGNAFTRNVRAFFHATDPYGMPMDDQGTIDWGTSLMRVPASVAGASAFMDGSSPYDNYDPQGGGARNLSGAAGRVSDAAAGRVGSVVGRGFIGRSPGATVPGRTMEPRNALGYQLGQVPGGSMGGGNWSVATAGRGTGAIPVSREGGPIMTAPTQAEIDAMAAEQTGGSGGRQRGSSQLGMTQLGQASSGLVMEGDARFRNRGGLMQEY